MMNSHGIRQAGDSRWRLPSTVFCSESSLSIPRPIKRHLVCCLPSAGLHVFSNLQSFISLLLNVIILHLQQKWALGTTVHRPQRWQGWGPLCPEPPALSGPPRPISPTRWWLLRWTWPPPGSAPQSSASRPLAEEKREPWVRPVDPSRPKLDYDQQRFKLLETVKKKPFHLINLSFLKMIAASE